MERIPTNQDNLDFTRVKLKEAKGYIKLFALDYDGTVSDGVDYKQPQVIALVEKILEKSGAVAFITARAATALKLLAPPLQKSLFQRGTSALCFIAGGNGTNLYEVKKDRLLEIYNYGLKLPQIFHAVEVGKKIYKKLKIEEADLVKKGLETFREFLKEDWAVFIPLEVIDVCRPYNGELFTETSKVTFVLPKEKSLHNKLVTALNKGLSGRLQAALGDETYVHITRKLKEESKVIAIKTILKRLGLNENQVATFGDMPCGNDVGLLSFPYSFTNSEDFARIKKNSSPPYVLLEPGLSPIARVYQAVEYLIH